MPPASSDQCPMQLMQSLYLRAIASPPSSGSSTKSQRPGHLVHTSSLTAAALQKLWRSAGQATTPLPGHPLPAPMLSPTPYLEAAALKDLLQAVRDARHVAPVEAALLAGRLGQRQLGCQNPLRFCGQRRLVQLLLRRAVPHAQGDTQFGARCHRQEGALQVRNRRRCSVQQQEAIELRRTF